ncbi:MAG TPA: nitronate monooxygenase [Anaerolineae bacterium]|nr:nitronate monooxygenase [Anaerolineae bacterium]
MIQTRITELFGIEHPVIGGCMMHVSGPEFVAAISNAGALGLMASAMFHTQEEFRAAVRTVKSLTERPFGVNLSLFPALRPIDNDLYVEVILEEGVPVVETSGHRPPEALLARLKAGGVKTMHKCVAPRHALSAQKAGVDAVTVFGTEGGGHIGELGLSTMVLVPRTVDLVDVPVLAAGGIADGRGLVAALALGAEGVTIGTRLLATRECPIHENLKRALLAATEHDTVPVLGSLHNTMRVWKNAAALRVLDIEARQGDIMEILSLAAGTETRRMLHGGEVDAGVLACSQDVGLVHAIEPVADVIQGMVREAEEIRRSWM